MKLGIIIFYYVILFTGKQKEIHLLICEQFYVMHFKITRKTHQYICFITPIQYISAIAMTLKKPFFYQ